MLMREKAVLVDGIVLIVLAVVITGLLEAIAWALNHFNLHLNSIFLAAGAICACVVRRR